MGDPDDASGADVVSSDGDTEQPAESPPQAATMPNVPTSAIIVLFIWISFDFKAPAPVASDTNCKNFRAGTGSSVA
jgi:hypothetical protein